MVLVISVALSLRFSGFIAGFLALPAVGSLGLALWQIFRDEIAYEHQIELKRREEFFNLSVTSHMATVAFDKYAAFCEAYVARVIKAIGELHDRGPSKDAYNIAHELVQIRQKHAPWVAANIVERLKPFEEALWDIGITSMQLERQLKPRSAETYYDTMYNKFMSILDIKRPEGEGGSNPAEDEKRKQIKANEVITCLQDALGITELTQLRAAVIKGAMRGLKVEDGNESNRL